MQVSAHTEQVPTGQVSATETDPAEVLPRLRRVQYEVAAEVPVLIPAREAWDDGARFGVEAGPVTEDVVVDPSAAPAAAATLRLMVEVINGRRALTQMTPYMSRSALHCLRALIAPPAGAGRGVAAQLRPLRLAQPVEGAAEVVALMRRGTRLRAIAARFDHDDAGRWRCTALRLL